MARNDGKRSAIDLRQKRSALTGAIVNEFTDGDSAVRANRKAGVVDKAKADPAILARYEAVVGKKLQPWRGRQPSGASLDGGDSSAALDAGDFGSGGRDREQGDGGNRKHVAEHIDLLSSQ
jgi:hypothetical protein